MRSSVTPRRRTAAIVVGAVVVAAVAGWLAASQIRSPAEVAAQTAPPEASAILVPAEARTISTDVVTRGTGRFGSTQQLTATASALKPSPGIVTTVPAPGTELTEGSVVMTVTGRPVFLLSGDRLGVRDLGPGLEGADVQQLEEAIRRLGFDPGPLDGVYDGATESAVRAWYTAAGFAPFEATEDQLASIRSAEASLASARVDQNGARDAVASAEADLAAARAAYADALATQQASPASVSAAEAEARAGIDTALADVATKQAALDALLADPDPPPLGAVDAARADLAAAHTNAESARRAGDKLIADARAASTTAGNGVTSAAAAVGSAEAKLGNARRALTDQGTAMNVAAQEANLAKRRAGVQVPADEVLFAPKPPVRVSEVQVVPGDQFGGPVLTAADASVAIDGSLPLADAPLVLPGMDVQIDETDLGISATGKVKQVAATPGTNGVDGFHIWFEVSVENAPPNLVGASVRLTVPVESTKGVVLAVPTSAVSLAADGSSRLQRDDNGVQTYVTVEPGLSADGFVEVTPVNGRLEPGDLVVVGAK